MTGEQARTDGCITTLLPVSQLLLYTALFRQNIIGRVDYEGKHWCSKIDVLCLRSCLGSWMPWCKTFKVV